MKVFIVEHGELCAGGQAISVHHTLDGAVARALAIPCHYDDGWRESGTNEWVNVCDYVKVVELEVVL
jgi:hypothetical protein